MAKKSTTDKSFDFEKALTELNELVEQMEQGGLSLEESLENFEKGIALTKACQEALQKAEQKVRLLTNKKDTVTLTDFNETIDE